MVRAADLPRAEQKSLPELECPRFDARPWVAPKPLSERCVTIINSAGLMRRAERPVTPRDPRYRIIPDTLSAGEVLMSHVSVNFDRTGFQQDLNCVLPRDRLHELARAGLIRGVAEKHYSFMGATEPEKMEPHARRLARSLRRDGVDTAILLPV